MCFFHHKYCLKIIFVHSISSQIVKLPIYKEEKHGEEKHGGNGRGSKLAHCTWWKLVTITLAVAMLLKTQHVQWYQQFDFHHGCDFHCYLIRIQTFQTFLLLIFIPNTEKYSECFSEDNQMENHSTQFKKQKNYSYYTNLL